jgi:cyclopropane fatty-acyl-phospholipid synthase-like methyltransferase
MEEKKHSIERCDIFHLMADYMGFTILHPGGFRATRILTESSQINEQTKVLDIGCGKGTTAVYLAEKYGCPVVGIDISADMVK